MACAHRSGKILEFQLIFSIYHTNAQDLPWPRYFRKSENQVTQRLSRTRSVFGDVDRGLGRVEPDRDLFIRPHPLGHRRR